VGEATRAHGRHMHMPTKTDSDLAAKAKSELLVATARGVMTRLLIEALLERRLSHACDSEGKWDTCVSFGIPWLTPSVNPHWHVGARTPINSPTADYRIGWLRCHSRPECILIGATHKLDGMGTVGVRRGSLMIEHIENLSMRAAHLGCDGSGIRSLLWQARNALRFGNAEKAAVCLQAATRQLEILESDERES
jgi:hypothetical protein